ncbi:hypothetical protein [Actinoplanes solisilvae]|uniref:hypothetical protein n=1 Tax=Actinoplanes solisilvae TaxID=2486853 RepID=UPI000FD98027|nr:hypothetical protein [Actinoplanes solisilvae]
MKRVLLLACVLLAGCSPDVVEAPPVFAAGCPQLSAPPFGIEAKGKWVPGRPQGAYDQVDCQYSSPASADAGMYVVGRVFPGEDQSKTFAADEQTGWAADGDEYMVVPDVGDGGFAWYAESSLCLAARSGTAYVVVAVAPGQPLDDPEPVREHLPALKALMTDALTALR